jgi:ribosome-associated translation inhibitor RaiA
MALKVVQINPAAFKFQSLEEKAVVIEEVQSNLYMAIDRAIERAGRALSRRLARKREYDHKRVVLALHDDIHVSKSENYIGN